MATEEPRLLSIQERIAALNQKQVSQNPIRAPSHREPALISPTSRPRSTNHAANEINGTVIDPRSLDRRQHGDLSSAIVVRSEDATQRLLPPPLPARKNQQNNKVSGHAAPPLPLRTSSTQLKRIPSVESTMSTASLSTTSTANTGGSSGSRATSIERGVNPLRAPAWGEIELPPLPPRGKTIIPKLPSGAKPISASSVGTLRKISVFPAHTALLPQQGSNNLSQVDDPAPKLPSRRQLVEQTKRLPLSIDQPAGIEPTARKLPPSSADVLNKAREYSFSGRNQAVEEPRPLPQPPKGREQGQAAPGIPPPVPLASKPDISKPQAATAYSKGSSSTSPNTVCLKCRDFSGPDAHAAQFPRQTLASNNLAWLANQLTAPFPSLTEKARVLFTWLHHNISYDVEAFFNNRVQPSTPQTTLASGLAVCEGYAGLFTTLATHAGLEAKAISGHGKGFGYTQLSSASIIPALETNHAWNVVKIDGGQWKLIDSCWGAGAVEGKGKPYTQRFEPSHFTMSNDEFGLRHFPMDSNQFYREDGQPRISWEEYIRGDPDKPFGVEPPLVFASAKSENGIGERTFLPAAKDVSVHQRGPIRFQFCLICEHWTLIYHSKKSGPYIFMLMIHGIDGRADDRVLFNHVLGSGPGGGGDFWYVDIAEPRTLGAPGQKLAVAALTTFGDRGDARGLTAQEYLEKVGKVRMGWSYIAEWQLV